MAKVLSMTGRKITGLGDYNREVEQLLALVNSNKGKNPEGPPRPPAA